jgi:hypothetical protein
MPARPRHSLHILFAMLVVVMIAGRADAHVGSPDVFYEGDAGPYHLFVTVMVPQVIPGVAQIDIRSSSNDVTSVSTSVARLTGAGSKYAPVPDLAKRSAGDPNQFTSSLWLMEYGSLRVILKVNGTHGATETSVPVPSAAQRMLPMPRWLGAILLALAIALGIGAISIVGAAARDSMLAPGTPVTPEARRRGRFAMAVSGVIVAAIFYGAFAWWDADANDYAAVTTFFKPPKLAVKLIGGNQLEIAPSPDDADWIRLVGVDRLVPDHGHLMHLFLVRTPGLDQIWHLHPDKTAKGTFVKSLPSIEPGHYAIFADVVDKSGFPWTLVGSINLPKITGTPMSGDDSRGIAPPIDIRSDATTDVLEDGTRVIWQRDGLPQASRATVLRFAAEDRDGKPANDLQPYMGMAAHAEIIKDDLSVFAHIHPSGTVPMASLMMVSNSSSMPGMTMPMNMPPGMKMSGMPVEHIAPELAIPYGFPSPGRYRIFLQFARAGHIETASFTTDVK